MRTFRILILTFLLGFITKPSSGQQLILGAGITPLSPYYDYSSLRLKASVTNLVNRFGVYGMWEINPYDNYGRDALGINYQLSCLFRVWAGVGIFEKGLLKPQNEVNPLNGLRKEMGIGYNSRYNLFHWELGYSFTLGPTIQFYYEIPLDRTDRNNDGKFTNADRSIPCALEWEKSDSAIEIVYDTIYIDHKPNRPICTNPITIDSFTMYNATSYVFDLEAVYNKNQVILNDDIRNVITKDLVSILKERPDLTVEIGAHTICDGKFAYNSQLSQRRADSIKNYLVQFHRINPSKIISKGYGEAKPVNNCTCEGSDVRGYTPYIDSVTRKQIAIKNELGQTTAYNYSKYEKNEIQFINNKAYVKCDEYQKAQNERITLRFKRNIENFAKIVDTCYKFIDPLAETVIKPKYCRNNFDNGSISFNRLNVKNATFNIFDIPVKFDRNKSSLDENGRKTLDTLANRILKANPALIFEIGSHSDCRQTEENNLTITNDRAESIRNYLINKHNIDSNRIAYKGYGESKLLNDCSCEGTNFSKLTPYIQGYTKKLDLAVDAKGRFKNYDYSEYESQEIKIIEGNPFVFCNEKQHDQNDRITMRFDTDFKNICIEKANIPVVKEKLIPPPIVVLPKQNKAKRYLSIDDFTLENAYTEIFTLPIFYDLDKAIIRPDAQRILDTFAAKIMDKYPFLIAELGSHTDCRMPYKYNERLAQRRADSAVKYLNVRRNIGPDRIAAKGYGETELINECHCEDKLAVEYTPYYADYTKKMLVNLDDDGNVLGTIYQDYTEDEIEYFGETQFVKCEEYQHRQNRRTTVRFTKNPEEFGIKINLDKDINNTNVGRSQFYERLKKGGVGHTREVVDEFKIDFKSIDEFKIEEAVQKAYALPIFYDLDKAIIRPDAQATLDSFAQNILFKYPKLIVELGSHTDCRMPYDYNENLSKRRADSAVDYLIKRWNISPKRIIAVGYGEHQLINDCSCEGSAAAGFTPFIKGVTRKMNVELDDEGNVSSTVYLEYQPSEITMISGKPHVKCEEYQHRQNRRTTVRFANDPRDFGIEIDVDVDPNNKNKK